MGIAGFPLQTITYGCYELFLFNLLSTLYSGKASGYSETTFSRCVYPDPFTGEYDPITHLEGSIISP